MEATCKDADGGAMCIMLHVDAAGFMHMLEILKYDDSPVIHPPTARDLVLVDPA